MSSRALPLVCKAAQVNQPFSPSLVYVLHPRTMYLAIFLTLAMRMRLNECREGPPPWSFLLGGWPHVSRGYVVAFEKYRVKSLFSWVGVSPLSWRKPASASGFV